MCRWMMSSRTSWTKTSRAVAKQAIKAWHYSDKDYFICPIFKTHHKFGPTVKDRNGNTYVEISYRGQLYFLKRFTSIKLGGTAYSFGTVSRTKTGNAPILTPCVAFSRNFAKSVLFDTYGNPLIIDEHGRAK
jgi:hypothetical protein